MNDTMAGLCADIKRSLSSVDPPARAGLSGTQEPRAGNGMDWWKMSQGFNYYHAYNTGWSNEMRRSFAPYTGVQQTPYFAGYWQSGRGLEYNMFWCLLHDCISISAWDTKVMFYNDFTYSEGGRDTLALCREFKRGIWDLIRTGQWQHDGIAIQYSQDAINAAQLAAKEEEQKDVRDVWVKLIEDLGLQYNFVATQQIEGGILTKPKNDFERYKVLVLPEAMAITDKERAAIEEFVKAGGAVIGDFNIGLYDGLCRKQESGMLDSLFGVKREGQAGTALDLDIKLPGAEARGVKLPVAEGMVAAGATSYALTATEPAAQAVFLNQVGKGLACCLNVDLRQYEDERTFHTPGEKQIRALLGAVFAKAGVKPVCDITFASGVPANLEVTRHRAGDLLFLGFERAGGDGDELATIKLPSAG
ncbi:MAG: beta-galactosidase trimerization domain-containing protein, partial [Armatimonadetes bacterium]|nr:beta-galactosidase trimerization domain-containing protein [Armatimonadota bacterium]